MAKFSLGLKAEGADYPVLRVFASWPGEANLAPTLEWKEGQELQSQESDSAPDSVEDPDRHPLATLDQTNFEKVSERLFHNWFQQDVEQKIVVQSKKRARKRIPSCHVCGNDNANS